MSKQEKDISKNRKVELLRLNGWYELRERNNWVHNIDVPKNWKGLSVDDAFDKLKTKIKKH